MVVISIDLADLSELNKHNKKKESKPKGKPINNSMEQQRKFFVN